MLSTVEQKRLQLSKSTEANKKLHLGQFLTPERTSVFMVSLFPDGKGSCRLLDAGAGIGSLSAAFLDRWENGGFHFQQVEVDAFELDSALITYLSQTLEKYNYRCGFVSNIYEEDFIHTAVESLSGDLFAKPLERYTHAILNPPYKKINSHSAYRLALRRVGIETVNLYSAFVALAVAEAASGGQIVAIIPRSFAMGRITARSVTSSLNVQRSATCTCLNHAAKRSRMTKYCRKTSSSAWSVAGCRGR